MFPRAPFVAHQRANRGRVNPPISRGRGEHRCVYAAHRERDRARDYGNSLAVHFRAHREADGRRHCVAGRRGDPE